MGYILPMVPYQYMQYANRTEKRDRFQPIREINPALPAILRAKSEGGLPQAPYVKAPEITGKGFLVDEHI